MDINYCYGENTATVRDEYREGHDLIVERPDETAALVRRFLGA
jgi:hypothetical protein